MKSMPSSSMRSRISAGSMQVARVSVSLGMLAALPYHGCIRRRRLRMRSSGAAVYQLSRRWFRYWSVTADPAVSRRNSMRIGCGSSQCPSPSTMGCFSCRRMSAAFMGTLCDVTVRRVQHGHEDHRGSHDQAGAGYAERRTNMLDTPSQRQGAKGGHGEGKLVDAHHAAVEAGLGVAHDHGVVQGVVG